MSVTQESLLRNWPRARQLLNEELELLRIRSRLEVNLQRWLSQGRRSNELLRSEAGLSEAEALLRRFRTSLSDVQLDYLQKSLKAQRGRRWLRNGKLAAVIGGLAVLLTVSTLKSLNLETKRKKAERALSLEREIANSAQQNEARAELAKRDAEHAAANQLDALQTRLKETEANAEQALKNAEDTTGQRNALQAELMDTKTKAQQAQKNAEIAVSQLEGLQARLKDSEAKAQKAKEDATELATPQGGAMEAQLRELVEKAELAQKIADLVSAQLHPKSEEPSKKEPPKTGTDSTNQVRSGRALPLDPGENADQRTSTQ